jgi:hypothetical protein
MSSILQQLLGPELAMTILVGVIWLVTAKATVGDPTVVHWAERAVWLMPIIAVALAFATLFWPHLGPLVIDEPLSWWRLGRTALVSIVGPCIAVWFIVHLFGSGAHGQDAAFIITLLIAGVFTSLGIAIGGAAILADRHEAFAEWFRMRPIIGSALTLIAALPIGIVLFFVTSFGGGMLIGLIMELRR